MFKTSSRYFLKELDRRLRDFSYPKLKYRIQVPPELRWWYWNEFGTAEFATEGRLGDAYKIPDGSKPGSEWKGGKISFPENGSLTTFITRKYVYHPGIHPHHMITSVLGEIKDIIRVQVAEAILSGVFDLEHLREVLMKNTMPDIKESIVFSFAMNLNTDGVRVDEYARLSGESAADVFRQHAEIVETT